MSSEKITGNLLTPTRRGLLMGAAALSASSMVPNLARADVPPTAQVNTTGLAVTDTEVTVGILHSVTGTMAISETGSVEAEKLAIEQINAQGGVLGRKIKFIQEDGASDWPTFAEKAKKLLVQDKCASVMGCWTSASRKAVLPVFEQYNGMLYYPTFYEGLEQSKNVIYTGQEATQQILAGLNWVTKEKGAKTFYLLGSDYIWPRPSNKIARKHIENVLKLKVAGEEYFPLGSTQFNSVINKMKLVKPDVIYAIIVGGSNVAFYKQLKAAGIDLTKQTLMTISVTEDEILGIGGENIVGAYACMKYFESLDNPNNKAFVPAFQKMWGEKTVIGDVTQAAYLGPWLWKPPRGSAMFGYSLGELGSILAMQGFAGLILFSVYLLMALGLAIIFGQMGVINMAHGEFMILGAYMTYFCSHLFASYLPGLYAGYFFVAMIVAFIASGTVGLFVEWALIQRLYRRPLDTLLATWGLSLIMQQAFRSAFGAREVGVELPPWMMGSLQVTDTIEVQINGLFVMGLTLLITAGVALLLFRSRWGLQVRSVVANRTMAGAVGIDTRRIDRFTFGLGCGIAGIAGSAFTMIGSTGPTAGQLYIVDTFLVVVFGGAQSLLGTIASALTISQSQSTLEFFLTGSMAKVLTLLIVIGILMLRPQGLFALKVRK